MRIAKTLLVLAALGLAGALVAPRAPVGAGAWPATALQPASALAADGHAGHGGGAPAAATSPSPAAPQPNEEPPTIEISPERQQMIGVKTALVTRRVLERTIRTVGRVEVDEQRQVAVTTKFEGWVEKLHADATGKFVRKGEPLAEIYSPELFATQQEFLNLLRWKKDPGGAASSWDPMLGRDRDAILEAARERLRLWDITDAQVRAIETSGKPIRTLTLFSPISGYVIQKMVVQGMRIMPGERLFDLADLSTVWVIADVYEYELPLIRPGLAARMRLSYFPDKEFSSKVDYVYPTLSGESRTARVRLVMPNPGGLLKPQMFSNIELTIRLGERLTVPDQAVIDTGTRKIAYVDRGEGLFEPREVATGLATERYVEILRGVKEGERVASSANFLIDSEAQLRGVVPLQRK
jgi:Cu(I)/Ag(I) efflux system membrane fusion protein